VRKGWCRRYLEWIGEERMAAMGYDLSRSLAELDGAPDGRPSPRDAMHLAASWRADRARAAALALQEGPLPIGRAFE
jgi:hypothetical protein